MSRHVVDVKEIRIIPGHCLGSIIWIVREYNSWNANPGHSAKIFCHVRNGVQYLRMNAFKDE